MEMDQAPKDPVHTVEIQVALRRAHQPQVTLELAFLQTHMVDQQGICLITNQNQ